MLSLVVGREVRHSAERIAIVERLSTVLSECGLARIIDADLFGERGLILEESYEAKQHVERFGRASDPVCRSLCSVVGALASSLTRSEYLVVEEQCVAKGDDACRFFARAAVHTLADVEREYLLAVLARNASNQTRTARELGIGSATLYRKLKSYESSKRKP